MSLDTLVPTLVGGLLALGGALGATYLAATLERRHRRRSLAGALAGEIGAILGVVEKRGYLRGLDDHIALLDATNRPGVYYFPVSQNYFQVYEANVGSLGLLSPGLARDVVKFYTYCKAFLEDVYAFKDAWEGSAAVLPDSKERMIHMRDFLQEGVDVGQSCVHRALKESGLSETQVTQLLAHVPRGGSSA